MMGNGVDYSTKRKVQGAESAEGTVFPPLSLLRGHR